ncbi:MAG: TlpA family protein disulfide reductase [Thiohalomonadaceae bacterium]
MRKSVAVFLAFAALAGGATAGYFHFSARPAAQAPADFRLPDLQGQARSLDDWAGQVRVVNFWAPWCPPCRREIPELVRLQEQYADHGLVVIGITVDTVENTRDFAAASDIRYPLLIADEAGIALARRFGNTVDGLPFTAVVDRQGRITHVHPGELSLADAVAAVKPLL